MSAYLDEEWVGGRKVYQILKVARDHRREEHTLEMIAGFNAAPWENWVASLGPNRTSVAL